MVNSTISCLMLPPLERKVYFLLAKKLKPKANPVDRVLLAIFGSPRCVNKKSNPKSSAVLIAPTIPKRMILLFFIMRLMILLNEVERALFCLVENPADILADDAEKDHLHAA